MFCSRVVARFAYLNVTIINGLNIFWGGGVLNLADLHEQNRRFGKCRGLANLIITISKQHYI